MYSSNNWHSLIFSSSAPQPRQIAALLKLASWVQPDRKELQVAGLIICLTAPFLYSCFYITGGNLALALAGLAYTVLAPALGLSTISKLYILQVLIASQEPLPPTIKQAHRPHVSLP